MMSNASDGMNYAPKGKAQPVVKPGEFIFSAVRLDHGHIFGMCNGLTEAGGTLKYVYDKDPKKVEMFLKAFPQAKVARSEEEALEDKETHMIAGAAVTSQRCELGLKALSAGKDYFTDKAPFTTLEQLNSAKEMVKKMNRRYMVYYSERLHVEGAVLAGYMVEQGLIGKVVSSRIANYGNPEHPELDDFGDCTITGKNGTTNYFRVDWFTPDGLRTWGDGRTIILGTKGYIEIRKYVDVARDAQGGNHVFLVNGDGEKYVNATGVTGYPFFGQLILDSLNRTENAMTQAHAFKAAELCLQAQAQAVDLTPDVPGRK